jgi:hypothetical protein
MDDKHETQHVDYVRSSGDVTPVEPVEYDANEEKRLIRRIDKRLLPILGCLYAIAAVDRVNVSQITLPTTTKQY